jgi:hypothetical protein
VGNPNKPPVSLPEAIVPVVVTSNSSADAGAVKPRTATAIAIPTLVFIFPPTPFFDWQRSQVEITQSTILAVYRIGSNSEIRDVN